MRILFFYTFLWLSIAGTTQPVFRNGALTLHPVGDCLTSTTVKASVNLFVAAENADEIANEVELCWGDGTCEPIAAVSKQQLASGLFAALYEGNHSYASRGTYVVSFTDCCYAADFISFRNRADVPIRLEQEYRFPDPQLEGCNTPPMPIQPPFDESHSFAVFHFNPIYFDRDGDSLSYELVELSDPDIYVFPGEVDGCTQSLTIDPATGTFAWDSPCLPGNYLFGIRALEWRNGINIGENTLQLQAVVLPFTATQETGRRLPLQAFPNPTRGALYLGGQRDGPVSWQLLDEAGGVLQQGKATELPVRLALHSLPAGLYFLRANDGNRTFAEKIIKK